jgi:hypothetical protein
MTSTAFGRDIDSLYFGYRPVAGHFEHCSRHGTDVFEVTTFVCRGFDDESRFTAFRFTCFECGVVAFQSTGGAMDSFASMLAADTGYGSRPEKIPGREGWLWPGPPIWSGDQRGPLCYLMTATPDRPRSKDDVIARVGWRMGPRGGTRWAIALSGCEHDRDRDWASKRAAAIWAFDATSRRAVGEPGRTEAG